MNVRNWKERTKYTLNNFFNVPWDKKLRETKRATTVATAQVGVSAKDLPFPFSFSIYVILNFSKTKNYYVFWWKWS